MPNAETPDFAVIIPLANEENEFAPFITAMTAVLDALGCGAVYLVIDRVSQDRTLELCRELSSGDGRFTTIWAPENRTVIDAYLRGFREAYQHGHDFIIEMDAGMSHDPQAIPQFIDALQAGYSCVFGSRFAPGGSMTDSPLFRRMLSRGGTLVANMLLGTRLTDMTSGFQGFRAEIVDKLLRHDFLSTAHFYQTEVRYLLRKQQYIELPINYRAPSPRVSLSSILNSLSVLTYYACRRIAGRPALIT
jgi:dolichol-phosphate mannosyltransferase